MRLDNKPALVGIVRWIWITDLGVLHQLDKSVDFVDVKKTVLQGTNDTNMIESSQRGFRVFETAKPIGEQLSRLLDLKIAHHGKQTH